MGYQGKKNLHINDRESDSGQNPQEHECPTKQSGYIIKL